MGFSLRAAINYDPQQVISKRRHTNKNNPFEHTKLARLREEANWEDYPNNTLDNINMEPYSVSPIPGNVTIPQWIFLTQLQLLAIFHH